MSFSVSVVYAISSGGCLRQAGLVLAVPFGLSSQPCFVVVFFFNQGLQVLMASLVYELYATTTLFFSDECYIFSFGVI